VDRIGAKAEMVSKPIEVFLPYIGGTHDEKQYRVVMDRERWFQILMAEEYRTDESYTEKTAERIPLPVAAAEALAFDLSVNLDERGVTAAGIKGATAGLYEVRRQATSPAIRLPGTRCAFAREYKAATRLGGARWISTRNFV
jgi:hypothetical protein